MNDFTGKIPGARFSTSATGKVVFMRYYVMEPIGNILLPAAPKDENAGIVIASDLSRFSELDYDARNELISERLKLLLELYMPTYDFKPVTYLDTAKDTAKQLRAEGVNAKWYQAWGKNFPANRKMTTNELNSALARNKRWIDAKIKQGYKIYDIGPKPGDIRSPFYALEKSRIDKFGYPTINIFGR